MNAGLTLIDLMVLIGVGVVLPLSIGGRWRYWLIATVTACWSLLLPTGLWAAVLVGPWLAVAGVSVVRRARAAGRGHEWRGHDVVEVLTRVYAPWPRSRSLSREPAGRCSASASPSSS